MRRLIQEDLIKLSANSELFIIDAGQDAFRGESLTNQIKSMTAYSKTPQPITQRKAQAKQAVFKKVMAGLGIATVCTACVSTGEKNTHEKTSAETAIVKKEDLLSGNTNYYLHVHSDTTVPNAINIQEKAIMVSRCKDGEFDVYIATPTYNADHESVFIRWNDGRVKNENWIQADSSDALFTRRPNAFLDSALKADTLVFGWLPYQSQKVAAKWKFTEQNKADFKLIQNHCS